MTSLPDERPDEVEQEPNPFERMAQAVVENEQGIRQFLDDLASSAVTDDTESIRAEVRSFARSDPFAFYAVTMALNQFESFFTDLEASEAPEETVGLLRDLGDTYESLAEEFLIVNYEKRVGAKNPWLRLRTGTAYDDDEQLPLMDCELVSEGVTVGEFRVPPSQALTVADLAVAHAGYLLGDLDDAGKAVDAEELARIRGVLDEVEASLEATRESLEGVDAAGSVADYESSVEETSTSSDTTGDDDAGEPGDATEESAPEHVDIDSENYYFN